MFLSSLDGLCSGWLGDQGAGVPHSGGIQRSLKITQEHIQHKENGYRSRSDERASDQLDLESGLHTIVDSINL